MSIKHLFESKLMIYIPCFVVFSKSIYPGMHYTCVFTRYVFSKHMNNFDNPVTLGSKHKLSEGIAWQRSGSSALYYKAFTLHHCTLLHYSNNLSSEHKSMRVWCNINGWCRSDIVTESWPCYQEVSGSNHSDSRVQTQTASRNRSAVLGNSALYYRAFTLHHYSLLYWSNNLSIGGCRLVWCQNCDLVIKRSVVRNHSDSRVQTQTVSRNHGPNVSTTPITPIGVLAMFTS